MRKIETLMNRAIAENQPWRLDNTRVDAGKVYLHGNLIADVREALIILYDGGCQSRTTKSRLNAILAQNGHGNERIFQKQKQWFISYDGKVEPFVSGMILS